MYPDVCMEFIRDVKVNVYVLGIKNYIVSSKASVIAQGAWSQWYATTKNDWPNAGNMRFLTQKTMLYETCV